MQIFLLGCIILAASAAHARTLSHHRALEEVLEEADGRYPYPVCPAGRCLQPQPTGNAYACLSGVLWTKIHVFECRSIAEGPFTSCAEQCTLLMIYPASRSASHRGHSSTS
jgi:hypothetical protein